MRLESLDQTLNDARNVYGEDLHVYIATDNDSTPNYENDDVVSDFSTEVVYMRPMEHGQSHAVYDHSDDSSDDRDGRLPVMLLLPKHEGDDESSARKTLRLVVEAFDHVDPKILKTGEINDADAAAVAKSLVRLLKV